MVRRTVLICIAHWREGRGAVARERLASEHLKDRADNQLEMFLEKLALEPLGVEASDAGPSGTYEG